MDIHYDYPKVRHKPKTYLNISFPNQGKSLLTLPTYAVIKAGQSCVHYGVIPPSYQIPNTLLMNHHFTNTLEVSEIPSSMTMSHTSAVTCTVTRIAATRWVSLLHKVCRSVRQKGLNNHPVKVVFLWLNLSLMLKSLGQISQQMYSCNYLLCLG